MYIAQITICLLLYGLSAAIAPNARPGGPQKPVARTYVGTTPCSNGTRPIPGIPSDAPCELIKWRLTFLEKNNNDLSGTYVLDAEYGMPRQGTRDIAGGRQLHRTGNWDTVKHPLTKASIYRLDPGAPEMSISFIRLSERLIHLLDSEQQLMIGSGAWSYTLNKTDS